MVFLAIVLSLCDEEDVPAQERSERTHLSALADVNGRPAAADRADHDRLTARAARRGAHEVAHVPLPFIHRMNPSLWASR
jgi:hypothetical protein